MPHHRKFIDKKKAITFKLVHRSQHDPLIADDTAGERVLVPLENDQRKIEQQKFGIDYNDDYNYLQHLRDPCAPPEKYAFELDETEQVEEEEEEDDDDDKNEAINRFNLPSTVFESKTTNEIGMLNLAAPDSDPKIHWDPDVIAALDDDEFDYNNNDNALDDDFMFKANGIQPLADDECDEFEDEIINESLPTIIPPLFIPKTNKPIPLALRRFLDQDDDDDEMKSNESMSNDDDDRDRQTSKTKYTNYSMTSSVIRRNQGLQNVDEHFDKIFDEYDDEQIGSLDAQQINQQGISVQDDLIQQTVQQFEQQQMQTDEQIEKIAIEKTRRLAQRLLNESEATTTIIVHDDENHDDKWDCETVLTTYSNIYNHPKLIQQIPQNRIRLSNKTGLPLDNNKITAKRQVNEQNDDDDEDDLQLNNRPTITFERKKGETSEERRARKHAVKDIRRDRRVIKKATKVAFKQEEQKQLNEQALHSAQAHLQSLRVA